jgi:hypothetical protein
MCGKPGKFRSVLYFSVQNYKYATKLGMYIQDLTRTVPIRQLHSVTIVRITDLEVTVVAESHIQVRK